MHIRTLLMGGASRITRAPEDDRGYEDADALDVEASDEDLDDAGQRDADGGAEDHFEDDDDGADEGDEDGQAQVAARSSRGSNRIATLNERARSAETRAEALERRLAEIEGQSRRVSEADMRRQEEERLANMDPEERIQYRLDQQERRFEARLQAAEFSAADRADKAAFDAYCATNPAASKVKDKVEAYLADMRKAGTTAPRDTVLKYVLGELALSRSGKARAAGQRTESAGRQREQVRAPSGSRGDVPQGGGRRVSERDARRARLDGVSI